MILWIKTTEQLHKNKQLCKKHCEDEYFTNVNVFRPSFSYFFSHELVEEVFCFFVFINNDFNIITTVIVIQLPLWTKFLVCKCFMKNIVLLLIAPWWYFYIFSTIKCFIYFVSLGVLFYPLLVFFLLKWFVFNIIYTQKRQGIGNQIFFSCIPGQ